MTIENYSIPFFYHLNAAKKFLADAISSPLVKTPLLYFQLQQKFPFIVVLVDRCAPLPLNPKTQPPCSFIHIPQSSALYLRSLKGAPAAEEDYYLQMRYGEPDRYNIIRHIFHDASDRRFRPYLNVLNTKIGNLSKEGGEWRVERLRIVLTTI